MVFIVMSVSTCVQKNDKKKNEKSELAARSADMVLGSQTPGKGVEMV